MGYYTPSLKKDLFYTPLSQVGAGETPRQAFGVEIHASLIQYLLGTVLDGRPVLKTISDAGEGLLIGSWAILGGCAAWRLRRLKSPLLLLGGGCAAAALLGWAAWEGYYLLFLAGWWLPAVPSLAGLWLGALLGLFYIFRERHLDYLENLEAQVKTRTADLEQSLSDLKLAQSFPRPKRKSCGGQPPPTNWSGASRKRPSSTGSGTATPFSAKSSATSTPNWNGPELSPSSWKSPSSISSRMPWMRFWNGQPESLISSLR